MPFKSVFQHFRAPKRGPQGHPKSLINRPSRPKAPRGLPKGRPRLAQEPPGSDFELISAHFGSMLAASEAHLGFMWGPRVSSSSVWVVVSRVSLFVALSFELRLDATTPPNPLTTTPLDHNVSKKGGRRHGGGALKITKQITNPRKQDPVLKAWGALPPLKSTRLEALGAPGSPLIKKPVCASIH